jgi:hypothetical protein
MNMDIGLLIGLPRTLVAGSDAEVKKFAEGGIDIRADNLDLGPDHLGIERSAKVVGELLADRVPVGLQERVFAFIIIPDRTGVGPDKVRDGDVFCSGRHGDFLQ